MLPIRFTKMSGAGNTFVLASGLSNTPWHDFEKQIKLPRAEFAKMICDRVLGIGTDGFLLLEQGAGESDYRWDFYNSDGSSAEMCGNAARCATRYCYEVLERKERSHFKFMTGAGLIEAMILGNDLIRVEMSAANWLSKSVELEMKLSKETFAFVNTGVPHLVQKLHQITDAVPMKELAREARHHRDLKPQGANVTFYAEEAPGRIQAVTFERGVEDFTLACGTGAVAAALVYRDTSIDEKKQNNIEITMPGGVLNAIFTPGQARPFLEGEAVFIGDFEYSLEVFL